jgi:hypothetical protein
MRRAAVCPLIRLNARGSDAFQKDIVIAELPLPEATTLTLSPGRRRSGLSHEA